MLVDVYSHITDVSRWICQTVKPHYLKTNVNDIVFFDLKLHLQMMRLTAMLVNQSP